MVRDPVQAFDIFIKITLIPGQEEAFEEAFASRMAATREEPGNILFELSRHPDMPNVYMLHERWASLDAVERHMSLPHMASFWPIYFPMIARVPEFEIYATRDLVNRVAAMTKMSSINRRRSAWPHDFAPEVPPLIAELCSRVRPSVF